jgi:hypothetical protein
MTEEIGTPVLICLTCSVRLIPAIASKAASLFLLSANSYLQRRHIELDKPHILA